MLTDTGELSPRELWLRLAIAAVALVVVLLVGNYVFETRLQEAMVNMQQAIEADRQRASSRQE